MAENFYTLLTTTGKAKIANAAALGTKVNFKTLKVGDGNGNYYDPTETQTDLQHVVWQGNINSISIDETNSNWIISETIIPATDGGFFIREAGIFDEDGDLIAIAKMAATYKPVVAEGSTKDLSVKIILEVSSSSSVMLKVDTSVIIATKSDINILTNSITQISAKLSDITQDRIYYCGTTSGTNTYTAVNSKITAYTDGLTVRIKIGTASTGASTLNINGLGAKTILDTLGNPITSGGLKAGLPYQLCYNGTNFIVLGKGGGGTADASKILAPYSATVDGGQVTGTIPSKASTTYNPSTSAQTISAGQYLSGPQTIAAVGGNATTADVVAGKTFSSANGINQTGTATMASLGGKLYATSTVTSSSGTIGVTTTGNYALSRAIVSVTGLTFTPSRIKVKCAAGTDVDIAEYDSSIFGNLSGAINIFSMQTSGSVSGYNIKQDANVKVTNNGFVFPVSYSNAVYTWEAYA